MARYSSHFEQTNVESLRALIPTVYVSVNHSTLFKFPFKAAIAKIMLLIDQHILRTGAFELNMFG